MSTFASRSSFVLALLAVGLSGQAVCAQSNPVTYGPPAWLGFGGNLNAGQGSSAQDSSTQDSSQDSSANGRVLGFEDRSVGGLFSTRYNFSNGWFVGSERNSTALSMSGLNQPSAFGSLQSEGVQFGYNFQNAPVSVYAGFNTLKYNSGIAAPFTTPLDSITGAASGYGAHAGIEFKPVSNLSVQLGAGFTQRSGRIDTDTSSRFLTNDSQFDLVRPR